MDDLLLNVIDYIWRNLDIFIIYAIVSLIVMRAVSK